MRHIQFLSAALAFFSLGGEMSMLSAAPAPVVDPSLPKREHSVGWMLGQDLVRGCEVFEGKIIKVGTAQPDATDKEMTLRLIDIRIDRSLHGQNVKKGDIISVTQGTRLSPVKSDSPRILDVWRGIEVTEGQRLLVVRWPEGSRYRHVQFMGDEVEMVVADGPLIDRIAVLIPRFERYVEDYKDVVRAFWYVRDAIDLRDPLFSSYLVGFMEMLPESNKDNESWEYSVLVLSALLNDKRVGQQDQVRIATFDLTSGYSNLSASAKKTVLQSLLQAAGGDDEEVAYASLVTLANLVRDGADVAPLLDEETKARVAANYQTWAGKRQLDKEWSRKFADMLGVK